MLRIHEISGIPRDSLEDKGTVTAEHSMGHTEGFRDFLSEEITVGNPSYFFDDKSENYAAGVAVFGLLAWFKVERLFGDTRNHLLGSPVSPLGALERFCLR